MKRITVAFPDEIWARLEREARRLNMSVAEFVRQTLNERFASTDEKPREVPFIGLFSSDKGPFGHEVDELLEESWADAILGHR